MVPKSLITAGMVTVAINPQGAEAVNVKVAGKEKGIFGRDDQNKRQENGEDMFPEKIAEGLEQKEDNSVERKKWTDHFTLMNFKKVALAVGLCAWAVAEYMDPISQYL